MNIEREILIEAPMEVVWKTITEPDQITRWFADTVDLEVTPGGHGYMGFGEQGGPVVVEAVEPPRRFSFRWNHPKGEDPTPDNSLLVEFTLEAVGTQTRLRVAETGVEGLGWEEEEQLRYAEEHNGGWATFLERLDRLVSKRSRG